MEGIIAKGRVLGQVGRGRESPLTIPLLYITTRIHIYILYILGVRGSRSLRWDFGFSAGFGGNELKKLNSHFGLSFWRISVIFDLDKLSSGRDVLCAASIGGNDFCVLNIIYKSPDIVKIPRLSLNTEEGAVLLGSLDAVFAL